ncbi:MAG: hypothetical protein OEQ53_09470 [Saprospiraceae bacterium]|nr:hypothetical protein [Saprospiraceae bacterium]
MKKLITLLVMVIPMVVWAQADYSMYQTIYLKPDLKNLKTLGENLAAHNKKFHSEGPHSAVVWQVVSGPKSGGMVWAMGPCTFSDLDNRPAGDDHQSDWRDNVLSLLKDASNVEYWRQIDDLSVGAGGPPSPMIRVRYSSVVRGQGYRVRGLFKKMSDAIKAMEGDQTWGVYVNELQQGYENGRHWATTSGFDSWSEFDEDGTFRETFVKVHGENSWVPFLNEIREVFSNTWDEMWRLRPDLSGVDLGN